MKKAILAASVVLASTALIFAAGESASRLKVSGPVDLPLPAMHDSTNVSGKKFTPATLFETHYRLDKDVLNHTIADTDTAGFITVGKPDSGVLLTVYETRILPEKYIEGTLEVSSPAVFEILVDGKSKKVKEERQDSLSPASTCNVNLSIEPARTSVITVKVLTTPEDADLTRLRVKFTPDEEYEDVVVNIDPEVRDRFMIEATEAGNRLVNATLSSDGKYILLNYSEKMGKKRVGQIVLKETASMKTIAESLPYGAEWMPSGHDMYFTIATDDGFDVYTLAIPSMKRTRVAQGVPDKDFVWSPDNSYLLYTSTDEGQVDEGPLRRLLDPDDRIPGNRDRSTMIKYDIATGIAMPIVYDSKSVSPLDISADGKKILYMATWQQPDVYPFGGAALIQIDAKTLLTDTIIKNDPYIKNAIYSPDAKRLFIMGGPESLGGIGREDNGHPIPNDYDCQGYIYDIATGKANAVTLKFDPSIDHSTPIWNYADNRIYFVAEEGFGMSMFRLNPDNGVIDRLPQDVQYVRTFSMGAYDTKYIAYTGMGFNYCGQGYLLNVSNMKTTLIDNPMAESLAKIDMGKSERWTFNTADGTEIEGYITYPPGFDPDKKYPMIVYYYGGTSPTAAGMTSPYTANLFASRGYVVYMLNPSGTTGYGQEFSARHVNAWGKYTADDIIEGVKKVCESHPFIDADKIGCIGASYGGFMTQYLLTQTDIFAAAVSHAGISNVTSYWGVGYWGYSYNTVAAAKSYPWSNPELFTNGSLFNADKIHTPLLLLHGTVDTNVPIGESIQLFNALRILGRNVEFISVDDQNHFISDWDKRVLWHATIMAWFAKYLQDDPRWWDSIYGD